MLGIPRGVAAAACICAALGGCASVNSMLGGSSEAEALAALKWSFAPGAVVLEVGADPDLNLYDGRPHTLVLGVGQGADPNGFLTLLAEPGALPKLLQTGKAPGMLSFERVVVAPGRHAVVTLDRAEGARFIGVIAFYNQTDPPQHARLFRIPVEVLSEGAVVKKRMAQPQVVGLQLRLGPAGFAAAAMVNPMPPEPGAPVPAPEQPLRNEGVISAQEMSDALNAARAVRRVTQ